MTPSLRTLTIFADVAQFLEYPPPDFPHHVAAMERTLAKRNRTAARHGRRFREETSRLAMGELEELYTRTFDLAPLCSPLVSTHLFGDESFQRARLMTGLREHYAERGFDPGPELPDHIGTLLRFVGTASREEGSEIDRYLLRRPLQQMAELLRKKNNPYVHLLLAVVALLEAEFGKEHVHA